MDGVLPFEKAEIERSIGERFAAVVRAVPDRPAVRLGGRVTTYAHLDALSGRFARAFSACLGGASADEPPPIALLIEPGELLFAAMLGALRAGRSYVPLDPRLPAARLSAIASGLDAAVLVAAERQRDAARDLAGARGETRWAEEIAAGGSTEASDAPVPPDALAYVLFTSGSTGVPKGVMQSHRNVLHSVRKLATALAIRPDDRLALLASVSVGASVSDVFGALLLGAAVCPYDLGGDGLRRLPRFLANEAITICHCVPSVFRSFSATLDGSDDLSRLRIVRLGGEPIFASDFDLFRNRFPRSCAFHLGFGATEMNVIRHWAAGHETPWPGGTPLGHAVDETEVVLLDEQGRETDGEGEIAVRARTLALGYWKDPAATADAFLAVPGRPGWRLFRTGDLGRFLPDGCLLHAGRRDARLKVRGHRVETTEVESALLDVAGVREAVAGGLETPRGTRLAAWVVRSPDKPPALSLLRRSLAERLPASLWPSTFVFLDALPRTPSGKIDRAALPPPSSGRPPLETPFVTPRDSMEEAAVSAFREALDLSRVGADDDFFELGGDSLAAVTALSAASDALGVELSAADLIEAPTPAALAARARRSGGSTETAPVALEDGSRTPVFIVPGGAGDRENVFGARSIARSTGGGFPFFCFRPGPAPHPPAPVLAERFLEQLRTAAPRGPYALVGDCVGGTIAFEMGRRLREAGASVLLVALLDAPFPTPARRRRVWLSHRAPAAVRLVGRLSYFRRRLAYHLSVLRTMSRGRADYVLHMGRVGARGLLAEGHHWERIGRRASYVAAAAAWDPAPYDGRLVVIESAEGERRGFSAAWSRLARSGCEIVRVPGSHADFFLDHGAEAAAALRRALEAAELSSPESLVSSS
jgi:amino acid adenylation domain-containing protein